MASIIPTILENHVWHVSGQLAVHMLQVDRNGSSTHWVTFIKMTSIQLCPVNNNILH